MARNRSVVVIGEVIGHYRILEKLGEGGMGEVYAAEDTTLGRRVAIKILPADMADDEQRLQRLESEARTVAAISHPNIVTLYSIEEEAGRRFLTMELVEGLTLEDKISADGRPPRAPSRIDRC